jgi:hypothetical protein
MADKSDANSSKHQRRKSIPRRPENANPNYLKLILQSIGGKELSKTAVPVEFNEPLSMLQRQTEELEYAHLLDLAALETPDSGRRLAFICAFAISAYSTVGKRPTKPFNPMLGETYECDRRTDRGWRLLAEQVNLEGISIYQFPVAMTSNLSNRSPIILRVLHSMPRANTGLLSNNIWWNQN